MCTVIEPSYLKFNRGCRAFGTLKRKKNGKEKKMSFFTGFRGGPLHIQ